METCCLSDEEADLVDLGVCPVHQLQSKPSIVPKECNETPQTPRRSKVLHHMSLNSNNTTTTTSNCSTHSQHQWNHASTAHFKAAHWAVTKVPMRHPLTHLMASETLQKMALKMFHYALKFAQEFVSYDDFSPQQVQVVQILLKKCLQEEALCDEFFLQMVKQTTDNPEVGSPFHFGNWQLLTALCHYVYPPNHFVLRYLWAHLQRAALDCTSWEGKYAKENLKALEVTLQNVSRRFPPSRVELVAVLKMCRPEVQVHFQNGSHCTVSIRPYSSVFEIRRLAQLRVGMRFSASGWALYEVNGTRERHLNDKDYVGDILYQWEIHQSCHPAEIDLKFMLKKRLFTEPVIQANDPVEVELFSHQCTAIVFEGGLPLDERTALKVCALRAMAEDGDVLAAMRILPRQWRDKIRPLDVLNAMEKEYKRHDRVHKCQQLQKMHAEITSMYRSMEGERNLQGLTKSSETTTGSTGSTMYESMLLLGEEEEMETDNSLHGQENEEEAVGADSDDIECSFPSSQELQWRFIHLCQTLPLFGAQCFEIKVVHPTGTTWPSNLILGVNSKGLLFLTEKKYPVKYFAHIRYSQVLNFQCEAHQLRLHMNSPSIILGNGSSIMFASNEKEPQPEEFLFKTPESAEIVSLMRDYINHLDLFDASTNEHFQANNKESVLKRNRTMSTHRARFPLERGTTATSSGECAPSRNDLNPRTGCRLRFRCRSMEDCCCNVAASDDHSNHNATTSFFRRGIHSTSSCHTKHVLVDYFSPTVSVKTRKFRRPNSRKQVSLPSECLELNNRHLQSYYAKYANDINSHDILGITVRNIGGSLETSF